MCIFLLCRQLWYEFNKFIYIGIDFYIEGLKYILKGFWGDKLN